MSVLSIPSALDAIVKASLILGITALVAASLRRASASARHLVWMLGLVSALAVPALSIVTPRWELPIVRIAQAPEATAPLHSGGSDDAFVAPSPRVRPAPSAAAVPSTPSPRTPFEPSPAQIALAVWALGAAI